ncbi:MAG: YicC family protein [Bryobacterales bacterium]|nr:YicC family protein [Bryobacterales bacterium]MBV9397851.1 YicC family protein [Bryobacterales bacterium]
MTGFARARRALGDGEVVVSVKSVNHRGLDIHVRAPEAADPFEVAMRALVKSHIGRGHIEIRISVPSSSADGSAPLINHAMLEQYLRSFQDAAVKHGLNAVPDLNTAFRFPGMFGPAETELPEGTEAILLDALAEALHQLNAFREREGAEIAVEMQKHAAQVGDGAEKMEEIRLSAVWLFQNRLTEKLKELLKGAQVDPQRLAQEAAILADRSDIGEELARLKIHSRQLLGLIESGGEIGKKLDFLLQEMNRETNTILSKTGGAGEAGLRITELALAAKAAIEKIREQALNLE